MPINGDRFQISKKFFKVFGEEFSILDDDGNVVAFAKQRMRLREDIRLYTDKTQSQELLRMRTNKILDLSPTFEVIDGQTEEKVGSLKRDGIMSSFVSDSWSIIDADGNAVGSVKEDSWMLGLFRRFVTNIIPQAFHIRLGETVVGELRQNFNPFTLHVKVDFSMDTDHALDRRLGIAAAVLACAIESRQN